MEFLHETAVVNLDGDLGDLQFRGNLFIEPPLDHQAQDLELPRREITEALLNFLHRRFFLA